MGYLESKILLLTAVYFVGWFLIEKVFTGVAAWWGDEPAVQPRGARRAIPPLAAVTPLDQTWRYIRGLQSHDWRIRRISCVQLGDKRGTAVVQALIQALDDRKEEVSMAAGEALAKIGDPAAIQGLSDHLKRLEQRVDRSFERYRAA